MLQWRKRPYSASYLQVASIRTRERVADPVRRVNVGRADDGLLGPFVDGHDAIHRTPRALASASSRTGRISASRWAA
jgi:hypothetical protein